VSPLLKRELLKYAQRLRRKMQILRPHVKRRENVTRLLLRLAQGTASALAFSLKRRLDLRKRLRVYRVRLIKFRESGTL
jgi:hypothetical protein